VYRRAAWFPAPLSHVFGFGQGLTAAEIWAYIQLGVCTLLAYQFRSWLLLVILCTATVGAWTWWGAAGEMAILPTIAWHAVAGSGLIAWAVRDRMSRIPPYLCQFCRYDLRGLPGTTCPECGRAAEPIGGQPGAGTDGGARSTGTTTSAGS
jgi:hypothetical protein